MTVARLMICLTHLTVVVTAAAMAMLMVLLTREPTFSLPESTPV